MRIVAFIAALWIGTASAANLGGGVSKPFYWLIVDLSCSDLATAQDDARARHKRAVPGAEISVYANNAGTQAAIKVVEGDVAWRNARTWKACIVAVYDETNQGDLAALMLTPEWARPDPSGVRR